MLELRLLIGRHRLPYAVRKGEQEGRRACGKKKFVLVRREKKYAGHVQA